MKRLGTDRLDLYLLHWPGQHPLEDTIAAFEELVRAGKIKHYGVSNFDVEELGQAVGIAGEGKIVCNQVLYHLKERAIEHRVIPFCEEHGIAVVAYSPFGSGDFPGPATAGGRVLEAVARARGATPRQVALGYLIRRESVFAIPKAGRAEHAVENAGAAEVELRGEEVGAIEAAFPRGPVPEVLPVI